MATENLTNEFKEYVRNRASVNITKVMGGPSQMRTSGMIEIRREIREAEYKHPEFEYWFDDLTDEEYAEIQRGE